MRELIGRFPKEYIRKTGHVSLGLFLFFIYPLLTTLNFLILILLITVIFLILRKLPGIVSMYSDKNRRSLGEIYFPLGIGLAAILMSSQPELVLFGILVLSLSDALTGLSGLMKTRYVLWWNKSFEGSSIFFLATLIVTLVYFDYYLVLNLPMTTIILITATATLVEAISPYGSDNLILPLATVLAAYFFTV